VPRDRVRIEEEGKVLDSSPLVTSKMVVEDGRFLLVQWLLVPAFFGLVVERRRLTTDHSVVTSGLQFEAATGHPGPLTPRVDER